MLRLADVRHDVARPTSHFIHRCAARDVCDKRPRHQVVMTRLCSRKTRSRERRAAKTRSARRDDTRVYAKMLRETLCARVMPACLISLTTRADVAAICERERMFAHWRATYRSGDANARARHAIVRCLFFVDASAPPCCCQPLPARRQAFSRCRSFCHHFPRPPDCSFISSIVFARHCHAARCRRWFTPHIFRRPSTPVIVAAR